MRAPAPTYLVAGLLLCGCMSHAQSPPPTEKNWKAVCKTATATPLQAPALSGPLSPAQVRTCDAAQFYYGDGVRKPEYAAALQCAWYGRAHADPTRGDMFAGTGTLTMLYANGYGVTRNYDLAIRFACEEPWAADAEQEYRIGHLEAMRAGADTKTFDLCDDVTSGLNMGACQAVTTQQHTGSRDAKIAAEVAGLPPSAKALFPALRGAEKAFEEARAGNEIDMSGTARGMFYEQELDTLAAQFLINLQRFHKQDVPVTAAADLQTLDSNLNATYQQLMKLPASRWDGYGTIKPEGIRDTERAWLKLVDAWVRFGREAYPQVSETSLRAQLIRLRLHQLQSLAKMFAT